MGRTQESYSAKNSIKNFLCNTIPASYIFCPKSGGGGGGQYPPFKKVEGGIYPPVPTPMLRDETMVKGPKSSSSL